MKILALLLILFNLDAHGQFRNMASDIPYDLPEDIMSKLLAEKYKGMQVDLSTMIDTLALDHMDLKGVEQKYRKRLKKHYHYAIKQTWKDHCTKIIRLVSDHYDARMKDLLPECPSYKLHKSFPKIHPYAIEALKNVGWYVVFKLAEETWPVIKTNWDRYKNENITHRRERPPSEPEHGGFNDRGHHDGTGFDSHGLRIIGIGNDGSNVSHICSILPTMIQFINEKRKTLRKTN